MAEEKCARWVKSLFSYKNAIILGCNFLLCLSQSKRLTCTLKSIYGKFLASSYLNSLITNVGVRGGLQGRDFQCVVVVFSI